MSNRNDDDFRFDNEDDLFRNDNFDNFDDNADLDDNMLDIGDDPIVLDDDDSEEPQRRGGSRTFVILAVLLVVILLLGFGALLFFLSQGQGGSPELNATRTSIAERNATTIAQLATIDAQGTVSFVETATAMSFTATPTPTFTPSPTFTPEVDLNATATSDFIIARETQDVLNADLTSTQLAVTGQGGGGDETPTPEGGILSPVDAANATSTAVALGGGSISPISVDAVNMTSTALAALFDPSALTAQANINSTSIAALPTATGSLPIGPNNGGNNPNNPPDELANTGLFDDLNAGTMSALALVAFGLVGVIAAARRVRRTT